MTRRILIVAATAALVLAASAGTAVAASPSWATDAHYGIQELMGSGDGSPVGWNSGTGLWGGQTAPRWWQSAIAVTTLARYGERTPDQSSAINKVLVRTYQLNVNSSRNGSPNFINQYSDDTAWWGMAWLAAAQWELNYRQDQTDAARFLAVAEADAAHINQLPRPCGGIQWSPNNPPHTINQAGFITLTAALARFRASGPFHNSGLASQWLSDAQAAWNWLENSGLVNTSTGRVTYDSIGSTSNCQNFSGGPVTYTQGEVADALVQLGLALNQPSYFSPAQNFIQYTLSDSEFMYNGVLQNRCEALSPNCQANSNQLDITAFKGIFMWAVGDWSEANPGSSAFSSFDQAQATAIVNNAIYNGAGAQQPGCVSATTCQLAFSWARLISPPLITDGTQSSALGAFIDVLQRS